MANTEIYIRRIALNSVLAAMSFVLAVICRAISLPVLPFLKFEISDVPIFTATLISGTPSGITLLCIVSLLRTLFLSISGWTGFMLRMVSSTVIIFLGIYAKKRKFPVFFIIAAVIMQVIIKIPISYVFWVRFHGMSPEMIKSAIPSVIIPFNIIKTTVNILLALALEKSLKKILNNINYI